MMHQANMLTISNCAEINSVHGEDADVQREEDTHTQGFQDQQVESVEQAWNDAIEDEHSPLVEDAFGDPLAIEEDGNADAQHAIMEDALQDDTASEGSHPSSDMSLESPGSEGQLAYSFGFPQSH